MQQDYNERTYIPRYSTSHTTEHSMEDQAVLESFYRFRAVQQWNWLCKSPNYKPIVQSFQVSKSDPMTGIMAWYRKWRKVPITYPQPIPIREWDFEGLAGTSENQLLHHHYHHIEQLHLSNLPKQKNRKKILVLFECSNNKPYNNTNFYKWYMRALGQWCDFGLADYGIIPMECAEWYPYVADEWDHFMEGKYMHELYNWYSKKNFQEVMDAYQYEDVFVCIQHPSPREWLVDLAKTDPRIHIVIDDKFDKKFHDKYITSWKSNGIIILRKMQNIDTRIHICSTIYQYLKKKGYTDIKPLHRIILDMKKNGVAPIQPMKYKEEYPSDTIPTHDVKRWIEKADLNDDHITIPSIFESILNNDETTKCSTVLQYLHDLCEDGRWNIEGRNIHNDYWGLRAAITNHPTWTILELPSNFEQGYIFYHPDRIKPTEVMKIAKREGWLKKNVRKRTPDTSDRLGLEP